MIPHKKHCVVIKKTNPLLLRGEVMGTYNLIEYYKRKSY